MGRFVGWNCSDVNVLGITATNAPVQETKGTIFPLGSRCISTGRSTSTPSVVKLFEPTDYYEVRLLRDLQSLLQGPVPTSSEQDGRRCGVRGDHLHVSFAVIFKGFLKNNSIMLALLQNLYKIIFK